MKTILTNKDIQMLLANIYEVPSNQVDVSDNTEVVITETITPHFKEVGEDAKKEKTESPKAESTENVPAKPKTAKKAPAKRAKKAPVKEAVAKEAPVADPAATQVIPEDMLPPIEEAVTKEASPVMLEEVKESVEQSAATDLANELFGDIPLDESEHEPMGVSSDNPFD